MKKKLLVALGLSGIIAASVAVGAYAASDIKLFINGKLINSDIQVVDGSSYVPLRVVSETLGAEVKWDGEKREIQITGQGYSPVKAANPAKSYDVKVNVTNGPMTMDISKVTLDPAYKEYSFSEAKAAIILDVTVENTSNDKVEWFVDQSTVVLNTKEQIEDTLSGDERITSEFNGKVVKQGKIIFPVKSSKLEDITNIKLLVKYVLGENLTRLADNKETEIILK
ncbi:stalk domain-containing protein [Bacillus sp. 3255]|uniref:stalk domain-containing protein n=1 Tax=Bacillus sp. 3255 TaxID=2817904 RepID=UPI002866DF35|nr:stalk domain-containing protein [Bacillus sp. 3255]MDR6883095.1 hypothetical protein [Bacillus sp. 3255]